MIHPVAMPLTLIATPGRTPGHLSLHRLLAVGGVRMLCSHGEEVADPFGELAALLGE